MDGIRSYCGLKYDTNGLDGAAIRELKVYAICHLLAGVMVVIGICVCVSAWSALGSSVVWVAYIVLLSVIMLESGSHPIKTEYHEGVWVYRYRGAFMLP
jgi:uncharacterized protein (DUF983 family)